MATVTARHVRHIPIGDVFANPAQPRQTFDADALQELATSIASQGLLQPIQVTPRDGRFMIVCGERRYRAHVLNGADTIACEVRELSDRDVMLQAIVENAVRRDVNLIEEATAYQRALDLGATVEDLAAASGAALFRIKWRLSLLNMRPEYQALARSGQVTAAQALELAKLEPAGQDRLFRAINAGQCETTLQLAAMRADIQAEAAQIDFLGDDDKPSEADRRYAQGFEARVRRVVAVLNASTVDNEVVAVKRVDPTRAATLADMFAAMRGDIGRIEAALRRASETALV